MRKILNGLVTIFMICLVAVDSQVAEYNDQHVIGGVLQEHLTTGDECIGTCQNVPWCMAVDYDILADTCWFHKVSTFCETPNPMPGTRHVKLVQCYAEHHGLSGLLQPTIRDLHECILHCQGNCEAIDFDVTDSTCWFHLDGQACAPLEPKRNCVHVKKTQCNAVPKGFNSALFKIRPVAIIPVTGKIPVQNNIEVLPRRALLTRARGLFGISRGAGPGIHISREDDPHEPGPLPTCGKSGIPPSGGRIIGGDEARAHSWPWQVALKNRNSRSVRCAGTIIAPQWVLTTAHCVDEDLKPRNWLVFVGAHDLLAFEADRFPYQVETLILHEHFDLNTFDNDIALLKLTRPLRWGHAVRPACLPPPHFELKPGTTCNILGWGVSKNGRRPLKEATVPLLSLDTCRRKDWLGNEFIITERMMCAGYEHGGFDTCQGDSGGPLLCYVSERWVQIGVTSFGRGCGLPQKPGVYTKVSKFIAWITNKIELF